MVIVHFFFEIIKIAILSSLYAIIIVLLFSYIGKRKPESFFSDYSKNRLRLWVFSGFSIAISLFLFMFSYWGNHGLGDSARIPIGHGKEVSEIDGVYAYIEPSGYEFSGLNIQKFVKKGQFLIGTTDSNLVDKPLPYFSWDLKNDDLQLYQTELEFNQFIRKNQLPKQNEFKSFREQYKKFWGGWRFWLLP